MTTLVVVRGEVKLEGSDPQVVRSNEQLTVSQSGVQVRRLSREELITSIEWHTVVKVAPAIAKAEPPPEPS